MHRKLLAYIRPPDVTFTSLFKLLTLVVNASGLSHETLIFYSLRFRVRSFALRVWQLNNILLLSRAFPLSFVTRFFPFLSSFLTFSFRHFARMTSRALATEKIEKRAYRTTPKGNLSLARLRICERTM